MYRGQMADLGQSEIQWGSKSGTAEGIMYRGQMADLDKARYSGKEERDNKTRPLTPMLLVSSALSIYSTSRADCR